MVNVVPKKRSYRVAIEKDDLPARLANAVYDLTGQSRLARR
jgi:hypothetical protein